LGLFKKKKNRSEDAQDFGKRLLSVLKGKPSNSLKGQDSNIELIIGFIFFFGGLYFIFNFITS